MEIRFLDGGGLRLVEPNQVFFHLVRQVRLGVLAFFLPLSTESFLASLGKIGGIFRLRGRLRGGCRL